MDIASSAEAPMRVTSDRVKNPKRQEHMKKVNENKKQIKLKIEQERQPNSESWTDAILSWKYLVAPSVLVVICGILYVHQKYVSTTSIPVKNEVVSNVKETIKESKFSDF